MASEVLGDKYGFMVGVKHGDCDICVGVKHGE